MTLPLPSTAVAALHAIAGVSAASASVSALQPSRCPSGAPMLRVLARRLGLVGRQEADVNGGGRRCGSGFESRELRVRSEGRGRV